MSLDTDYQRYIHKSRYGKWEEGLGRREEWPETVGRYGNFFLPKLWDLVPDEDVRDESGSIPPSYEPKKGTLTAKYLEALEAVDRTEVMPSMRAMMTAGKALERDNVAGYNCAYRAIDDIRAFDELMYVLMCGTGVGFSVERQFIGALPEVAEEFHASASTIVVPDSKIGWSSSYRELVSLLYGGKIPKWDVSKVRPAGARLKTFGGRASGPEPLVDLFKFTIEVFKNARGRKLTSVECHDLACKVADIVVVGGVRRSALISLSNLTDERMRVAKSGQWWMHNPQRALANNSVCYTEKPDMGIFMKEWEGLYASKSGERGIFSREASRRIVERNGRRDPAHEFGTNPCSEIILRSKQFCNLTEVVVRGDDTLETLKGKVRHAAILGTLQSTLTNFRYLSRRWKTNTEEERLLGVSLTGIMDHEVLSGGSANLSLLPSWLEQLKEEAIATNNLWANKLGIPPSAAITCVKPSGTVSQLVDSASGIHPRYSDFYIRTVRSDAKDPISQLMAQEGVPWEWSESDRDADGNLRKNTMIFSFPVKSPHDSVKRNEISALQQLNLWKIYAEHWCEHKPSITVYVREPEWLAVGAWVYENFDILSGVSFLPHSDHTYTQAPYQEITEEEYNEAVKSFPKDIDWSKLSDLEDKDTTTFEHELACTGGACEIV